MPSGQADPAVSTRRRRRQPGRRSMAPGEWERLVRERAYIKPVPTVPALHQMARARLRARQHEDNTLKETAE